VTKYRSSGGDVAKRKPAKIVLLSLFKKITVVSLSDEISVR